MIKGIGTDIVEIKRIRQAAGGYEGRFIRRVYTDGEQAYCYRRQDPYPSLAAHFSAKEAVMKALGTGFRGIGWQDIEIVNLNQEGPRVVLHGRAALYAEEKGISDIKISLSHSEEFAIAFAMATGKESGS